MLFFSIVLMVFLPFFPLLLWSISEKWFYPGLLPQSFGLRAWDYVFGTAGNQIIAGLFTSFSLAAAGLFIPYSADHRSSAISFNGTPPLVSSPGTG